MSTRITRDQFFEFIRKKNEAYGSETRATKHYMKYFDKLQSTGRKVNWNWAGFLPIFFFYRRMFSIGFTLVAFSKIMDKLFSLPFFTDLFGSWKVEADMLITVIFCITCMMFADYWYVKHSETKIIKGKTRGGVSYLVLIIGIILFTLALIYLI